MGYQEQLFLPRSVDLAIAATDILPKAGKLAVLEHLLSAVTAETLKGLSCDGRKALITMLREYEDFLEPSSLEVRKGSFLGKYSVATSNAELPRVTLVLPEGESRMDLIKEASLLIEALYNQPALSPPYLSDWSHNPKFTEVAVSSTTIAVEGCQRESWSSVDCDLCDLATGHLAFYVATGRDLWHGHSVRGRDGAKE